MFSAKPRQSSVGSGNELRRRHLRARRKPAWDATPEEMDRRRQVHRSQNMDLVKQEKLRKHVAKLHQQRQLSSGLESSHAPNNVLRDILYGNNHIFEALETSDRLMASVKDLLGDNTKKFQGLPHVTKAPHHSQLDRSLPEVSEVLSRLDLNSESVMDKSALNDLDDEQDTSLSSTASRELDSSADEYRPAMDIARFKQLIRESALDQLVAASSSSCGASTAVESVKQPSQTVGVGQKGSKDVETRKTMRNKPVMKSGQSGQERGFGRVERKPGECSDKEHVENGGGDCGTPVTSPRMECAMNDTGRVQRVRSVLNFNNQSSTKLGSMDDFNEMLETIQTNLADSDTHSSTGFTINSAQRPSTYSGYTIALLDAVAKMSFCIKQNEMRSRADKATTEQLTSEVQHLHGLVDALTADILAVQEEYSRVKNDFVKYKRDTEIHWLLLSQTLSAYGIQLQLPIQQQLQPASQIANQRSLSQDGSPLPMQQQLPVAPVTSHMAVLQNGSRQSNEHQFTASSVELQRPEVSSEIVHHNQIPGVFTVVQQSASRTEHPTPSGSADTVNIISAVDSRLPVDQAVPLSNSAASRPIEIRGAPNSTNFQHFGSSTGQTNGQQSAVVNSAELVPRPALNDQQAFETRREVIRQQMAELNRQRLLAQDKINELKRHQMNSNPKVSPSISPITVASDPSGITFSTQISYDIQAMAATRQDVNGQSRRGGMQMPVVKDSQDTVRPSVSRNLQTQSFVSEDEWRDLECLYKACQAAITDGGLFTDTGVDERDENE